MVTGIFGDNEARVRKVNLDSESKINVWLINNGLPVFILLFPITGIIFIVKKFHQRKNGR